MKEISLIVNGQKTIQLPINLDSVSCVKINFGHVYIFRKNPNDVTISFDGMESYKVSNESIYDVGSDILMPIFKIESK